MAGAYSLCSKLVNSSSIGGFRVFFEWIKLPDHYGESTLPILPYQEGHTGSVTFRNGECLYYDSSQDIR